MKPIMAEFALPSFVAVALLFPAVCNAVEINAPKVALPHINAPHVSTPQVKTHVSTPQVRLHNPIKPGNSTIRNNQATGGGGNGGVGGQGGSLSPTASRSGAAFDSSTISDVILHVRATERSSSSSLPAQGVGSLVRIASPISATAAFSQIIKTLNKSVPQDIAALAFVVLMSSDNSAENDLKTVMGVVKGNASHSSLSDVVVHDQFVPPSQVLYEKSSSITKTSGDKVSGGYKIFNPKKYKGPNLHNKPNDVSVEHLELSNERILIGPH
jgi:hypothetical protein